MKQINEKAICEFYQKNRVSLRDTAIEFGIDHHRVKRILLKHGVQVTRRNKLIQFSDEHRHKISEACQGRKAWNKGKKVLNKHLLYQNMQKHLHYDVSLKWLKQLQDIEKLKFLNKSISRERDKKGFSTELYKRFIEKFYHDTQFNRIYQKWVESGRSKWWRPSLDHKNPKCKNGSLNDLENLQFLTWFENRAKVDMTQDEWEQFKQETHTQSDLFILRR